MLSKLFVTYVPDLDNGYIPLTKPYSYPNILETAKTPDHTDPLKIQYLYKFINLCKEHNIELVFMVSPAYTIADADMYEPLKKIANEYDIPFLDYHSSKTFIDNPDYFEDVGHLWDKGARIFTYMFASDLKNIIEKRENH